MYCSTAPRFYQPGDSCNNDLKRQAILYVPSRHLMNVRTLPCHSPRFASLSFGRRQPKNRFLFPFFCSSDTATCHPVTTGAVCRPSLGLVVVLIGWQMRSRARSNYLCPRKDSGPDTWEVRNCIVTRIVCGSDHARTRSTCSPTNPTTDLPIPATSCREVPDPPLRLP
jgi:hypothetical protein